MLNFLKEKLSFLKQEKSKIEITQEQKDEVEKKVEEYRKSLLQELEKAVEKDKFRLDSQISLLEEIIVEGEKPAESEILYKEPISPTDPSML